MATPTKKKILEKMRAQLKEQIKSVEKAVEQAREGFAVGDDRADNRGERGAIQEKSWLLSAQASRLEELQRQLFALENADTRTLRTAGAGALVAVREIGGRKEEIYLLHPEFGGHETDVGGVKVTVISPVSPLGRALVGKKTGEDLEAELPGGVRRLRVLRVS